MAEKGASAWEKKLNISTGAAAWEHDDSSHSRYEPTPYAVLERLAARGELTKENVLVDYGCGKGRVSFFLNHTLGMRTIGVDYDPAMVAAALENLQAYAGRKHESCGVSFACIAAEQYTPDGADCFYFFNPFAESILRAVLGRVLESWYARPRRIRLYFYYALDAYLGCLMTRPELEFTGEIDCRDLFHNDDPREKILIFTLPEPG